MTRTAAAIAAALFSSAALVVAHDGATSYSAIEVRGREVQLSLTVDAADFLDADTNRDGGISDDELERAIPLVFEAAQRRLRVTAGAPPLDSILERYELSGGHTLVMKVRYTFAARVTRVEVQSSLHEELRSDHHHVIRCRCGGVERMAVLDRAQPRVVFEQHDRPVAAGAAVVAIGGLFGYSWVRRRALLPR